MSMFILNKLYEYQHLISGVLLDLLGLLLVDLLMVLFACWLSISNDYRLERRDGYWE